MTLDREDIEAIASAVFAKLTGVIPTPPLPTGMSQNAASLITLARQDPVAAKAEALRRNREDSAQRAKKRSKKTSVGAHA